MRKSQRLLKKRSIIFHIDLKLSVRGPLGWLYRSRDDDRSITDAAWQRFQNGSITVEKAGLIRKGPVNQSGATSHCRTNQLRDWWKAA